MAIIELIIIIVTTIILSSIYASIIVLGLFVLSKFIRRAWISKILTHRGKSWLLIHFLCSVALIFISFTYPHDTGVGDNSKIPVGFGQAIQNEDFQWTYFYPDLNKTEPNKDALVILNYIVANNKICAEVSHDNSNSPKFDYIVYDLPTQQMTTFANKTDYESYARINELPASAKFDSFENHFHQYLASRPFWKVWLVP